MPKRWFVQFLCLALLNLGTPLVAHAGLIGTLQAVEAVQAGARTQDLALINAALAREQVRTQLVALGVDPAGVGSRVNALSDGELRTLAGKVAEAPAGGDAFAVIGIVFVVLLILEAVGVIDIFKKFP
jgi:hypothetical protein